MRETAGGGNDANESMWPPRRALKTPLFSPESTTSTRRVTAGSPITSRHNKHTIPFGLLGDYAVESALAGRQKRYGFTILVDIPLGCGPKKSSHKHRKDSIQR